MPADEMEKVSIYIVGGLKRKAPCLFEAGKIFGTGNIQTGKKFPEKLDPGPEVLSRAGT